MGITGILDVSTVIRSAPPDKEGIGYRLSQFLFQFFKGSRISLFCLSHVHCDGIIVKLVVDGTTQHNQTGMLIQSTKSRHGRSAGIQHIVNEDGLLSIRYLAVDDELKRLQALNAFLRLFVIEWLMRLYTEDVPDLQTKTVGYLVCQNLGIACRAFSSWHGNKDGILIVRNRLYQVSHDMCSLGDTVLISILDAMRQGTDGKVIRRGIDLHPASPINLNDR